MKNSGDKRVTIGSRWGLVQVVSGMQKPKQKGGQRFSAAPGCLLFVD